MNRLLSSICVGALCLSLTVPASAAVKPCFTDVSAKHWAFQDVQKACADRTMMGVGGGLFDPSGALTQAQFAAVLVRTVYPDEIGTRGGTEHWYDPELAVARSYGLLDMVSDPAALDVPISRYDMAAMIYELLQDWGATLPDEQSLARIGRTIADDDAIPERYRDAVRTVYGLDIIRGVNGGSFQGRDTMNRAHTAGVYIRLVQRLGIGADVLEPDPEDYDSIEELMAEVNALTPIHREGLLSNGKPVTEQNIREFLEALEKKFPDGSEWTCSGAYRYDSPLLGEGRGAQAFSAMISDWIFGEDAPLHVDQDYKHMKVGDVLRFRNQSSVDHCWVILDADRDQYQGVNGDAYGVVSWKSFGGLSPLRQNLNSSGSMSSVVRRY